MRLDNSYREKNCEKYKYTENKQHTTKKNKCINEEIKEEVRKYLKKYKNRATTFQNLWYSAKAVLRGKFIAIQTYLKKQENSQINNLTYHLKELEKEESKGQGSI